MRLLYIYYITPTSKFIYIRVSYIYIYNITPTSKFSLFFRIRALFMTKIHTTVNR